jgi:hypothetical protein
MWRTRTMGMAMTAAVLVGIAGCSGSPPRPAPNAAEASAASPNMNEIGEHTFTIPVGETVRAYLTGGTTYRAELDGSGVGLSMRPLVASTQPALIEKTLAGTSASGTELYTITPRASGEYEFYTTGGALVPLTLHLSVVTRKGEKDTTAGGR